MRDAMQAPRYSAAEQGDRKAHTIPILAFPLQGEGTKQGLRPQNLNPLLRRFGLTVKLG